MAGIRLTCFKYLSRVCRRRVVQTTRTTGGSELAHTLYWSETRERERELRVAFVEQTSEREAGERERIEGGIRREQTRERGREARERERIEGGTRREQTRQREAGERESLEGGIRREQTRERE